MGVGKEILKVGAFGAACSLVSFAAYEVGLDVPTDDEIAACEGAVADWGDEQHDALPEDCERFERAFDRTTLTTETYSPSTGKAEVDTEATIFVTPESLSSNLEDIQDGAENGQAVFTIAFGCFGLVVGGAFSFQLRANERGRARNAVTQTEPAGTNAE